MIIDQSVIAEVRKKWEAVENFRDRRTAFPTMTSGGVDLAVGAPFEFPNFPLLLAYGVLDDALKQLALEGKFISQRDNLGARMYAAQNVLTWVDFNQVDAGRDARNNLAHEAILIDHRLCVDYINAIGAELRSWQILYLFSPIEC